MEEQRAEQAVAGSGAGTDGYKKRMRARDVGPIVAHKLYSPADVSALLNVSYDKAVRIMERMPGAVNVGETSRRFRRGRRQLRISGEKLSGWLRYRELQ